MKKNITPDTTIRASGEAEPSTNSTVERTERSCDRPKRWPASAKTAAISLACLSVVVVTILAALIFDGSAPPFNPPNPGGAATAPKLRFHPDLGTPITGESSWRPAILVTILDDSESWFGTAELYLAAQSSRMPGGNRVLLPLNVGQMQGCTVRFVQLPFEVLPGDVIVFDLLDEDSLGNADETLLLNSCKSLGWCLWLGGKVFVPPAVGMFVDPGVGAVAGGSIGEAILANLARDVFDNYGAAQFVVPNSLPATPAMANKVAIIDKSNYSRATLQIYGPLSTLP